MLTTEQKNNRTFYYRKPKTQSKTLKSLKEKAGSRNIDVGKNPNQDRTVDRILLHLQNKPRSRTSEPTGNNSPQRK
uniref:DNA binding protein n=1 Tax=Rhizophora mucronata TaxID=61149 RepID=A0A2P2KXB5_RHIMU